MLQNESAGGWRLAGNSGPGLKSNPYSPNLTPFPSGSHVTSFRGNGLKGHKPTASKPTVARIQAGRRSHKYRGGVDIGIGRQALSCEPGISLLELHCLVGAFTPTRSLNVGD